MEVLLGLLGLGVAYVATRPAAAAAPAAAPAYYPAQQQQPLTGAVTAVQAAASLATGLSGLASGIGGLFGGAAPTYPEDSYGGGSSYYGQTYGTSSAPHEALTGGYDGGDPGYNGPEEW